jgi:hypothetical protein
VQIRQLVSVVQIQIIVRARQENVPAPTVPNLMSRMLAITRQPANVAAILPNAAALPVNVPAIPVLRLRLSQPTVERPPAAVEATIRTALAQAEPAPVRAVPSNQPFKISSITWTSWVSSVHPLPVSPYFFLSRFRFRHFGLPQISDFIHSVSSGLPVSVSFSISTVLLLE